MITLAETRILTVFHAKFLRGTRKHDGVNVFHLRDESLARIALVTASVRKVAGLRRVVHLTPITNQGEGVSEANR